MSWTIGTQELVGTYTLPVNFHPIKCVVVRVATGNTIEFFCKLRAKQHEMYTQILNQKLLKLIYVKLFVLSLVNIKKQNI